MDDRDGVELAYFKERKRCGTTTKEDATHGRGIGGGWRARMNLAPTVKVKVKVGVES